MTRQEAARILAVVAAPYGAEFDEFTSEAWYHSALERVDAAEGMEIARLLIGHEQFRPTPAVFNEALRNRRRQSSIAEAGIPALEAARLPSTHPAAEVIAGLRDMLATSGSRDHYHGGPNPCPVCGGLQPRSTNRAPLHERGMVIRGRT